ncbi:MAG: hypothetical protein ACQEP3_02595 [Patescibacteria group bacterium]
MDETKAYKLLEIILEKIPENVRWHLDGSVNLLIQGVDLKPNDLDVTTDDKGIEVFRDVFNNFIVEDEYGEKVSGRTLRLELEEEEIEINSYEDKRLSKFDSVVEINWKDLKLPILPLKEAKDFYKQIKREEKVKLITNFLKDNNLK